MLKLVFVGTILSLASAYHPVNHELVEEIKQKASWTPLEIHENPFAHKSYDEIKGLLGTVLGEDAGMVFSEEQVSNDVPASFDGRTQWGKCIHPIRDQQQCGSCWAFAGSETLSDRFCIQSGGSIDVVLSPEDMVECDSLNFGCNGGNLGTAWRYLYNTGIVSDSCLPYTSGGGSSGACPTKCSNSETWRKYKCSQAAVKSTTVASIKSDIYANGPVETGFTVYADFMNYKSGVYYHVSGRVEGGHAVKILGWGQENGMDYWLCANSWNTSWGEQGFFRIKQGDCGIDAATYGCKVDLASAQLEQYFLH